jgi:hypothetical protein
MMRFLSVDEVLVFRRQVVEQSGGILGVRDLGALDQLRSHRQPQKAKE